MNTLYVTCMFFLFIFSLLMDVMSCLKLLGVHVPQSVSVGDTVTLHCDYDLQGSPLYSLKWHKDGREFFRLYRNTSPILHLTSPMPPMPPMPPFNQLPPTSGRANRRKNQKNKQHHITQQHNLYQQQIQASNNIQLTPMVGIDVDEASSQNGSLVLRNVTRASSGWYNCEVSVDQTFDTEMMSQQLRVNRSSRLTSITTSTLLFVIVVMTTNMVSEVVMTTLSHLNYLLFINSH